MALTLHLRNHRQSGQGMVEYALILTLVAIVMIAILIVLGGSYMNLYQNIENGMAGVF